MIKWLEILLPIWEVPGSNIDLEGAYSDLDSS
jgi:hypothetical protein